MSMLRRLTGLLVLAGSLASPAPAFDLQSTTVPGRTVPSLTNGEIGINRADRQIFYKNVDGTIGVGSLLAATPNGRKAVEQGNASDLDAVPNGGGAAQTLGAWLTSLVWGSPTATSLRSFPRAVIFDGAVVYVPGYASAGDGGGGTFRWSAGSTATDDGVLTFAPPGGSGRWIRIFDGTLSILATGAVCDGTVDATPRAQAGLDAIAAIGTGGTFTLPANGACKLANVVWSSGSSLTVKGVGRSSFVVPASPTAPIFRATAGRVDFTDFTIFAAPGYRTAGNFIEFAGCLSCRMARIDTYNGYDLASWSTGSGDPMAVDVTAHGLARNGLLLDVSAALPAQQNGIAVFSRLRLHGSTTNTGAPLILVSADTVTVSDSNLDGFLLGVSAKPLPGKGYLANLFITNVLVDGAGGPPQSTTGDAWVFDGTGGLLTRIVVNSSWTSGMGGRGMYFKNVSNVTVNGMRVINSGLDGVVFDTGAKHIGFYQGTVSASSSLTPNSRHGLVLLAGSNDITIKDTRSGPSNANVDGSSTDSQACPIVVNAASVTHYRIQDNDLTGNQVQGLCDGGGGTAATAGSATSNATKFVFDNKIGPYTP